jgi:hypothetical protein
MRQITVFWEVNLRISAGFSDFEELHSFIFAIEIIFHSADGGTLCRWKQHSTILENVYT